MVGVIHRERFSVPIDPVGLGKAVFALQLLFWSSVPLEMAGVVPPAVRVVTGIVVLFLPGILLARLVGIGDDSGGRFVLFVGGLTLALLAAMTVVANAALPLVGVYHPLTFQPMAALLTATTIALFGAVSLTDREFSGVEVDLVGSAPLLLLLFALPTLAAVGAALLRRSGSNAGMYLFVSVLALVVLLTGTRFIRPNQYPVVVYFVALSALLHVNLVTNHVVGNDIQSLYYAANKIMEAGFWPLGPRPSSYALPVVTAVPATVSLLTGLELWATFTTLYVALFALVPVGIYYVGRDVFGANVGVFGALTFAFYHISFTYTPGKQLMAELFVVALLVLYFYEGLDDVGRKATAALLALGLVFTHYGTTYVFGLALLAATVGLLVVERTVGPVDHRLSLAYPVALLAAASAWYAVASRPLVDTLVGVPLGVAEQVVSIVRTGAIVGGAGASYVGQQSTFLEDLNLYVYVVILGLVGVGLAWDTVRETIRIRRGDPPSRAELTALAAPLFGFLGASYAVILNLYADRVIQVVLTVLAIYAGVGYCSIRRGLGVIHDRLRVPWSPLAALLVVLLALNSGLAFAAFAESESATFNPHAHDSTFSASERAAAKWLEVHSGTPGNVSGAGENQLEIRDFPGLTPVFTDKISYQLMRSVPPSAFHDVEVVVLKTEYKPAIEYDVLDEGYVFVRQRAVVDNDGRGPVPPEYLSRTEANRITEPRNVVYSSGDVRIVAASYGSGTNVSD